MWYRILTSCLVAACLTGPSRSFAATDSPLQADFQVTFAGCVESIGVGLAPTANVQALVPAGFVLAGNGQPVTPLVVRTSRCTISVEGTRPRLGAIVQVGAVIVPPDGTGDINNYTLFYDTDDVRLALGLRLVGVAAQFVPTMTYHVGSDSAVDVRVPLPGAPRLRLQGTVQPSNVPVGSFAANWWQASGYGVVKMATTVPAIAIGGADLSLVTNVNGALSQVIGSTTLGFPILQQFNAFTSATMDVQLVVHP